MGTNPDRSDTDGDGFSDGVEYSLGTNPVAAGSQPRPADQPVVQFTSANTLFTEGEAAVMRVQVTFSRPFQGSISYRVSAKSTMVAPADFAPLTGMLLFNGTTADLDIAVTDDFLIKPSRFLLLELIPPPVSADYRLGGRSVHFCHVTDDDSYWSGSVKDDLTVRDFRLRILRKAGQPSQIAFVSGASDGLNVIDNGASSQSTGMIPQVPQTVWDAVGIVDSAALFNASSPLMPVTVSPLPGFNGTSSAITSEPMTRRLIFSANNTLAPNQQVQRRLIVGQFTEEIHASNPTKSFLNLNRTGGVVLIQDIPLVAPYTPAIVPN